MDKQEIEDIILDTFTGEEQKNLLAFVGFLRASGMDFERGGGYWSEQQYYMVRYQGQSVCYLLLNGTGDEASLSPLTIWTDDSGSRWLERPCPDQEVRERAWSHVDHCAHCGSCRGGTCKVIFGREFRDVCRTTLRFVRPDARTLASIQRLVAMRREDILSRMR